MEIIGQVLIGSILGIAAILLFLCALWDFVAGDRKGSKPFFIGGIVCAIFLSMYVRAGWQYYALDEPMAAAASGGDAATVSLYLQKGASPEGTFDGETALELATRGQHPEVIMILREAGARR